jgi:RimJ/RimL family protein N-acetyltransferase
MTPSPDIVSARRATFIDTKNFYMRELVVTDASERMASWFDQPDVRNGLNAGTGGRSKTELEAYIRRFDQRSKVLLGIFDRHNNLLIGFLSVDIDWRIGRYLTNMVIGEEEYRNTGVSTAISPAFRHYFFDVLGLKVMTATALSTNHAIARYLKGTGWELNQILRNRIRNHVDGADVDLHLYSLTREAWSKWMAENPERLQAMLDDAPNSVRHQK